MKRTFLLILSVAIMAACSAPKYTYNFDDTHYPGRKKSAQHEKLANESLHPVQTDRLTASVGSQPAIENETAPRFTEITIAPVKKTYMQMNKVERKALRQHIKKEIKAFTIIKNKSESVQSTTDVKRMDNDLKLAAIFGAVGVVGLLIGASADVFWIIGGVALLIGVVFFVKWLVRQ